MKTQETSLEFKSFLQAAGLVAYCALVGLIFWQGENLFGKMNNFWGPVLFLTLFIASALICALIVFYYPYILFFEKNEKIKAAKAVFYTTGWLSFFVFLTLAIVAYTRTL